MYTFKKSMFSVLALTSILSTTDVFAMKPSDGDPKKTIAVTKKTAKPVNKSSSEDIITRRVNDDLTKLGRRVLTKPASSVWNEDLNPVEMNTKTIQLLIEKAQIFKDDKGVSHSIKMQSNPSNKQTPLVNYIKEFNNVLKEIPEEARSLTMLPSFSNSSAYSNVDGKITQTEKRSAGWSIPNIFSGCIYPVSIIVEPANKKVPAVKTNTQKKVVVPATKAVPQKKPAAPAAKDAQPKKTSTPKDTTQKKTIAPAGKSAVQLNKTTAPTAKPGQSKKVTAPAKTAAPKKTLAPATKEVKTSEEQKKEARKAARKLAKANAAKK